MADQRTGRQRIHAALRAPLSDLGWRSRAAGWFTRSSRRGSLWVLAFGIASSHAPQGEGSVTAYVGLRIDTVEELVAALRQEADSGYRSRTLTTPIDPLMSDGRSPRWWVDAVHVEALATEIAAAVEDHAVPYLRAVETDADLFLEGIRRSAAWSQSVGRIRYVVALEHLGRHQDAVTAAASWRDELHDRHDPAAHDGRSALDAVDAWLGGGAT